MSRLFEPIALGGVRVRNRTVMTAHGPRLGQARYERYLEVRSRGGVGLVILPVVSALYLGTTYPVPVAAVPGGEEDAVAPRQDTPEGIAFFDAVVPRLRGQAEAVRRGGAAVFGQLNHPGEPALGEPAAGRRPLGGAGRTPSQRASRAGQG